MLDSGNFSDNPTPAGDAKTKALLDAMGRLGYAAVNVGDRELVTGYDDFMKKAQAASFPFVSTNFVRQDTKEPVFKPYVIVEAKGKGKTPVRVGVLGVVRYNPVFQKAGPGTSNVVIAQPIEMLQKYLPEVRKKADVVVLLASLHKDDARAIARGLPGIDFVLGAFSGIVTAQDEVEGKTHLRYTGNQGKHVGESRVSLGADRQVVSVTHYTHMLQARYPNDDTMLAFVNRALAKIHEDQKPAQAPATGGGSSGSPSGP